jgi:hypothetical protein
MKKNKTFSPAQRRVLMGRVETLSERLNVKEACKRAGISLQTYYDWKKKGAGKLAGPQLIELPAWGDPQRQGTEDSVVLVVCRPSQIRETIEALR